MPAHHWKTGQVVDNKTKTPNRQRLRPQVYMHFEFGLVLGGDHSAHHHEMSYRSRGYRDRPTNFPRNVPAPDTNYLSSPTQQPTHPQRPQPLSNQTYYYYGGPPVPPPQPRIYYYGGPARQIEPASQSERQRRPSREERAQGRNHERGTSAPPPFGNNPWDVSLPQGDNAPFSPSPLTGTYQSRQPIDSWKALPEIPSRYRLGEDDMPWDAWSVPHGYDPDVHPQDEEAEPSALDQEPISPNAALPATSPTDVSTFSIGPTGPQYRPEDPRRIKELAGLSSAMMTVDNGFENQWWYQGEREAVTHGDGSGAVEQPRPRFSRNSLGWALASTPDIREAERHASLRGSIASPSSASLSGNRGSPDTPISFLPPIRRALSTRSDELFLGGGETRAAEE